MATGILLIGSVGNGKSTLGNFLIDPSETKEKKFPIGHSVQPETQDVSWTDFPYNGHTFTVIDTPGLNESAEKDLEHMGSLMNALNGMQGVSACLFCVKFNAKIDAQYKATVEYYSRLLPSLFEENVLIIMTKYETSRRNEELRRKQGIDVDSVKQKCAMEIKDIARLAYLPRVFTIDSLPMDKKERDYSLGVREEILEYVQSLQPVTTKSLLVHKTKYVKKLDEEAISRMLGEITGYMMKLIEENAAAKMVLTKVEDIEKQLLKVDGEIANTEKMLAVMDSKEWVVASTSDVSQDCKVDLHAQVKQQRKELQQQLNELECRPKHDDHHHQKEIKKLKKFINGKRTEIVKLSLNTMSISEAMGKVKELIHREVTGTISSEVKNQELQEITKANVITDLQARDEKEAPVNKGDEEEAPVNKGDEEETPVNKGDEEEAPVNKGDEEETPVNKGDEEAPANKGDEEETPVNKGDEEEAPVNKGDEEETPVNKGDEEAPANKGDEEAPANKGDEEEAPVNKTGDEEETPVNKGDEEEAPANKGDEEEAPANKGDEEAPANKGDEEEAPANKTGDEEETPVNKGDEEEAPANKSDEEEAPVNKTGDEEEAPANKGDEEETPVNKGDEEETPANKGDEEEVPANKSDEEETPVNKGDEEEAPANKGDEEEAPANKTGDKKASKTGDNIQ